MFSESRLPHGAALWRSRGSVGGGPIPADGCVDLILRDGCISVAGPSTRWITAGGDGAGDSFGFRLPPGRAGHLLGLDLAEIADQLVPLEDVASRGHARRLRAAMVPFADGARSTGAVSSLAGDAAESSRWSADVYRFAATSESAARAAAAHGTSERSFRRRMLSTFGYGYATLMRLERSRRAQALLRRGAPLVTAAAEAGFADQPHLSREFRRLVGVSPGQFAASSA
ncbi:AraC family transcriptional regulator [Microbacterium sp. PI-1]|uniref:helix-turn-helix transcriptional regulator n=1 Tax=Microbacterium sp. PI-1 TaxID=2545631 RepID=UPI00103F08A2|nr:helix-turn-helix transcriptional regulator [Microbacterium sp. PI-1]TCJ23851.1 AraC family transcriptional regulator [Microbacterium sp. PI-1]